MYIFIHCTIAPLLVAVLEVFLFQPPKPLLSKMATEKAAHSIPVDNFRSDQDSFDDWVKLFEDAVALATNAAEDREEPLCKRWLPLKLDERSRGLLKSCKKDAAWVDLKKELKGFLVDPQEKYNWQVNRLTPAWDGKESFHVLASKIKRLVDLYSERENKKSEYFFRFRQALPTDYRRAIDLGCDETKRTIDEAKKMAFRFQMSQMDSNPTSDAGRLAVEKNASFTGAAMSDDRLSSIETALQDLDERLDAFDSKLDRVKSRSRKPHDQSESSDEHQQHPSSRKSRHHDERNRSRDGYDHHDRDYDDYHSSSRNRQEDSVRRRHEQPRYDSQDCHEGSRRRDRDHYDHKGSWRDNRDFRDSRGRDHDSDRHDDRDDEGSGHRLATLDMESCFMKFCSMVVDSDNKSRTG